MNRPFRPLGEPSEPVDAERETALAFAKRFNLVADNGEIVCIKNCGREATLPSLCCVSCLAARRGIR
jgi:hypothetical protein